VQSDSHSTSKMLKDLQTLLSGVTIWGLGVGLNVCDKKFIKNNNCTNSQHCLPLPSPLSTHSIVLGSHSSFSLQDWVTLKPGHITNNQHAIQEWNFALRPLTPRSL
jgi:hypothetical protein